MKRRSLLVYGLLLAVWVLIVGWQVDEHVRVKEAAVAELKSRSKVLANALSAFIRGRNFWGAVLQERLEPVLNELVNERTNALGNTSELLSIVLLNTSGEPMVAAGSPLRPQEIKEVLQTGEHWWPNRVGFLMAVEGANVNPEGRTNTTFVLPPFRDLTNSRPEGFRGRGFSRRNPGQEGPPPDRRPEGPGPGQAAGPDRPRSRPGEPDGRPREGDHRPRRPPWFRWMDEAAFEKLVQKRELHGLVLAMSTDTYRSVCRKDLWLRYIIAFFAGISAVGAGVAWRNLGKSSELQIRLVRASELNTHLKQMNLAAAGLAHETRNPLNIIRGLAQMISKKPESPPEIRNKSREIIDETDKVTAQLNEFINYSRPRELRRSVVALNSVITEVVRALGYDLEEKQIRLETKGEQLSIEADEQLLRQVLFNLLINAAQAVPAGGEIQILAQRNDASEASFEVRDNGPGVSPDRRAEIFKPYFTTQQKGTGLGLAIVQQIVLAHGWEIECLSNEPKGAIFRVTHLKLVAKH